ncbi:MAG: 2-amino-4-hydroxy-6-hydroxymethyldihydropteridine diphosphokinase [Cyclobacteriaceae bacterium]|nr:2-amino-4-hydroxy-6-hydroxymethyldihydropteridine diphosphokinase [Cyclobacteriaceae bacterium]
MVRAFLLLGSNQGDRRQYIDAAFLEIHSLGSDAYHSSMYETAAWGKEDQSPFLNQVVVLTTGLSPEDLLRAILSIESGLGRIRMEKWGSRTIDIDILFYGEEIISQPDLVVPHPAIAQRRFTLEPMAELVPEMIHPVLKKSMRQLLDECTDTLPAIKIN